MRHFDWILKVCMNFSSVLVKAISSFEWRLFWISRRCQMILRAFPTLINNTFFERRWWSNINHISLLFYLILTVLNCGQMCDGCSLLYSLLYWLMCFLSLQTHLQLHAQRPVSLPPAASHPRSGKDRDSNLQYVMSGSCQVIKNNLWLRMCLLWTLLSTEENLSFY